jgi:hypothetical protein
MSSGAKWDGVYYNELYGFLHLESAGGHHIKGRWERPRKDKWGELDGEVDGNLMKFSWSEYTRGFAVTEAKKSGKGYFKYKRPAGATDERNDILRGELGLGENEVGSYWDAVKQLHVPPDLDSVGASHER